MSNEAFARVRIDALLSAQGWDTLDTNAVRFEIQLPDGTRADYVLCDRHGRSMAVVEAKRYSVSPGDAAAQAKAYAKQLGVPYAFLCNGNDANHKALKSARPCCQILRVYGRDLRSLDPTP